MKTRILTTLLALAAACGCSAAQAFTGTLDLSMQDGAVARHMSLTGWHVDARGVASFDYRYHQTGPGCAYARSGHAVVGFDELGDRVELEIYNPEDDAGDDEPMEIFYSDGGAVVMSMPVDGQGRKFWLSFEDDVMRKTLPQACGFTEARTAVIFRHQDNPTRGGAASAPRPLQRQ